MSLNLAAEIWSELKQYISEVDKSEAADSLVHLLVDSDFGIEDIKTAFRQDADVKSALTGYADDIIDEDLDDDEAEYDVDSDDDYN